MLRMVRVRASDPAAAQDEFERKLGRLREPVLLEENDISATSVHLEELKHWIPDYERRRVALARDPLASVDGFRVILYLVMKYLFGMRVCNQCPDCNGGAVHGNTPCQDAFGSNAEPEGGIFGRIDAAYISIEAQKSAGALHAHCQLFVQCFHQHRPLTDLLQLAPARLRQLNSDLLRYKAEVSREDYADK